MYTWFALGCFLVLMFAVVFQDFKQRAISAYLPILIFIASFLYAYSLFEIQEVGFSTAINIIILSTQFLLLYLYIRIFKKKGTLTNTYLGWGDILFLLALSPLFSPLNFVFFNLAAFILVAVGYLLYFALNTKADKHIPLAGLVALLAIPTTLILKVSNVQYSMYNDYWLMNNLNMIYG